MGMTKGNSEHGMYDGGYDLTPLLFSESIGFVRFRFTVSVAQEGRP